MNAIEYQEFKGKISEYKPLIAQLRDSLNIDYLNNKVKEYYFHRHNNYP